GFTAMSFAGKRSVIRYIRQESISDEEMEIWAFASRRGSDAFGLFKGGRASDRDGAGTTGLLCGRGRRKRAVLRTRRGRKCVGILRGTYEHSRGADRIYL